jgi:hypothetical protein
VLLAGSWTTVLSDQVFDRDVVAGFLTRFTHRRGRGCFAGFNPAAWNGPPTEVAPEMQQHLLPIVENHCSRQC